MYEGCSALILLRRTLLRIQVLQALRQPETKQTQMIDTPLLQSNNCRELLIFSTLQPWWKTKEERKKEKRRKEKKKEERKKRKTKKERRKKGANAGFDFVRPPNSIELTPRIEFDWNSVWLRSIDYAGQTKRYLSRIVCTTSHHNDNSSFEAVQCVCCGWRC